MNRYIAVFAFSLLIGFTGCGEEEGTSRGRVVRTGGGGTGADRTADPLVWKNLSLKWGDISAPSGECMYPRQFTLLADGAFTAGPCHRTSSETSSGTISREDLARISELMGTISSDEVNNDPPICKPAGMGTAVELKVADETSQVVNLQTVLGGTRCTWGGERLVDPLMEQFYLIANRYYPKWTQPPPPSTPTPDPVPTSVPTPDPVPAPTSVPSPRPAPSSDPEPEPEPEPIPEPSGSGDLH